MKKERLQEIIGRLEESPDMPLMMLIDNEAMEAIGQVRVVYPNAQLVMLRGIRYITITDKALRYILERLEREHADLSRAVKRYESDIEGIKALIGSGSKHYYSPGSLMASRQ